MTYIDWSDDTDAVADLKAALEAALHETGSDLTIPQNFTGIEGFYEDNIKVNKLAYRAIRHFNLPILHTWFRYGQYIPYDDIRPKKMTVGSLDQAESEMSSQSNLWQPPTREEIKGFFIEEGIEEMMDQDLVPFLRSNYQELAPDRYKKIYLANLNIIHILEQLVEDENLADNAADHREELKKHAMDLQYELMSNPRFDENVVNHVEKGLFAIQDGLISLEQSEDPTPNKIQAVKESRRLYHNYIWPWPAFLISKEHADGPSNMVADYSEDNEELVSEAADSYPGRINGYKNRLHELDMLPDSKDYNEAYGGIPSQLLAVDSASVDVLEDG